jgi:hypothetical protein
VATPLLRVPLPRVAAPFLKVTEPVAEEGVTVAVRVTVWPDVEGFRDVLRLVVVVRALTVWVRAVEVLVT